MSEAALPGPRPRARPLPPYRMAHGGGPARPVRLARAPNAPLLEMVLLTLWFLVITVTFRGEELLLYPLALYFCGSLLLRRHQLWKITLQNVILFGFPILAAMSMIWSPASGAALKFGVMLAITVIVAIYAGARFSRRQIVLCLFIAMALITIRVAPFGILSNNFAPFYEKNEFGRAMLLAVLASLAVGYDHDRPMPLRLFALGLVPISTYLIYLVEAMTSLVFALFAIMAMTGVWLMWSRFSRVKHMRSLAVLIGLAGTGVLAFAILNAADGNLSDAFFAMLGKDSTLTGRTFLWEAAERLTQERPWLGVGAEGFWRWGEGQAATLTELFYKQPGARFSFHNSYYEARVHLGWIGMIFIVAILAWCCLFAALSWVRDQSVVNTMFLVIAVTTLVVSFTESKVYNSVFSANMTLFYIAAVSAMVPRAVGAAGGAGDWQVAGRGGARSTYGYGVPVHGE